MANPAIESLQNALKDFPDINQLCPSKEDLNLFVAGLVTLFSHVHDDRIPAMCTYSAAEVVAAVFVAVLCGKNGWNQIAIYLHNKMEWCFACFPSMKANQTVPSHDTLNRIFSKLDIEQFQIVGTNYLRHHISNLQVRLGCIPPGYEMRNTDGKQERGTGRAYSQKRGTEVKDLQTLNIYDGTTGICERSYPIAEKTNEIPVAQQYYEEMEDAHGKIFTGDALHAQRLATLTITQKHGDYCFGAKGNQKSLLRDSADLFTDDVMKEIKKAGNYIRTTDKAHGNIEIREYYYASVSAYPGLDLSGWVNANGLVMVIKTIKPLKGGDARTEVRYYVTSLKDAKIASAVIRGHWAVEVFHNILDRSFYCDYNTTMDWNSVTNLFTVFKICIPMIQLLDPLVFGSGIKNVRDCINDGFEKNMGKLAWLFRPELIDAICCDIKKDLANLEIIRSRREEAKESKSAA